VPVSLDAFLTVAPVTGTFFNSGLDLLFPNLSVYEVTGISGTLNGNPITSFPAPQGQGSWLNSQFALGSVWFSAGGSECFIENDVANNLIEIMDANGDGFGTSTPIEYSAVVVSTPEPGALLLLACGIGLLGILYRNFRIRES